MIHKPPHIRLVIPEEVVMQPRFTVGILVLKAEGVVSTVRYSVFLFQTAPTSVVDKPKQIAVLVGHLSWDADLIAVEVVGLLAAFASEVVAALEHFAFGVVTVVFVAGYQSVGLVVFDHDVVAVGETAQFFAVASVNGGQIAIAEIDFGKQQPCAAVRGGDLVEVV